MKLFFLRIFIGGLLIYRESLNAWAAFYDPELSSHVFVMLVFVAIGILILAGVCTRLWYLILLLSYIRYNVDFQVMNLGPLLFIPLCWAGAVLDRTPMVSIDRLILARSAAYRRVAQWPSAEISVDDCNFVYGVLFLIYGVNSLAALGYHLRDVYWQRGLTVHAMLTNNFFCRYFTFFRSVESWSTPAIAGFSAASIVIQTVFQLLMMPLVFFRWGRWFVVLQGFAFFLFSLAVLQISVLPAIELVLWSVVFGSWILRGTAGDQRVRLPLRPVRTAFLVIIGTASAIAIGNALARSWRSTGIVSPSVEHAIIYLSIWPPDVFNVIDLKMGEQWYVIYRTSTGRDDKQIVPVFTDEGKRLYYHLADVIYYGNTLRWRRGSIGVSNWDSTIPPYLIHPIERLCQFDFRVQGFRTPQKYVVYFYRDQSMNLNLPLTERYRKHLLAKREFFIQN